MFCKAFVSFGDSSFVCTYVYLWICCSSVLLRSCQHWHLECMFVFVTKCWHCFAPKKTCFPAPFWSICILIYHSSCLVHIYCNGCRLTAPLLFMDKRVILNRCSFSLRAGLSMTVFSDPMSNVGWFGLIVDRFFIVRNKQWWMYCFWQFPTTES